jgi:hypothetical protein
MMRPLGALEGLLSTLMATCILPTAIISTVAGVWSLVNARLGDGGPATSTFLGLIKGIAFDSNGTIYFAETSNNRIRTVGSDGIVRTFAGSDSGSFSGDGGPATQAGLRGADGVAIDSLGNVYISGTGDYRVRRLSPDGIISTIAGTGIQADTGDSGPATAATLGFPSGLVVTGTGTIYVADGDRVRLLTPETPLGGGTPFNQTQRSPKH